ncbi:DNA alkylation repair protein [Candidatus Bipolaricaulota bacterium]
MRNSIERAIAAGALDDLASLLSSAATPDIRYAARRLARDGDGTSSVLEHAKSFASRAEPSARHVACHLLLKTYESDAAQTVDLLEGLLDDADWTVRDAAATIGGRLLRADFQGMLHHVRTWTESPSPSVRRAAVIAAGRAAHPRHLEWAEPLLKLLRRSLGPFALGAALLRHYPRTTFEYLTQWSTSNDAQVLWNVAMAFSAPPAATMAKKTLIILRKLSLDERRLVWRAVSSALWKLGRTCPEIVRPELARWLEDDRRTDVAREALKHL